MGQKNAITDSRSAIEKAGTVQMTVAVQADRHIDCVRSVFVTLCCESAVNTFA